MSGHCGSKDSQGEQNHNRSDDEPDCNSDDRPFLFGIILSHRESGAFNKVSVLEPPLIRRIIVRIREALA